MKKYFLLFLIALFLLSSASCALALEAKYPPIPGLPTITDNTKLPDFVIYFFGIGIYLAGILSLISLTIGAVGIIGASATGNPEGRSNAIDRIKGAGLGLVLVMASFIMLKTINPALTTPTLEPLGNLPGVFYTNGAERKPCPVSESNTSNIPEGFNSIIYTCDAAGPELWVWVYPKINFSDEDPLFSGTRITRLPCNGGQVALPKPGSFKMAYATHGIYYFLGENCTGYMSEANTSSQNEIQAPFKGNIKSVWISEDSQNQWYYGAIFHKEAGLQNAGACTYPLVYRDKNCLGVTLGVSSAVDIFVVNKQNPATSGNGAVFYTEPFGWSSGAREKGEGVYVVKKEEVISPFFSIDTTAMSFAENSAEHFFTPRTPEPYKKIDGRNLTFRDRSGSMEIKGKYLVGLYSGAEMNCQTFFTDVANLHAQPIMPASREDVKIDSVIIVPLK